MSGTLGGVDASIPLRAGNTLGTGANNPNSFANNPLAFIDALTRMRTLQLLPGELQIQQGHIGLQNLAQQQGALNLQKSGAELNAYRNNLVANGMMPLFAKGDKVTLADATNTLGRLHAAGYDTDGLTAMLAQSGETGGQGLLTVLKSAVMQAHPELGVPNMQSVNVGDQIVMQDVNPFTNPAILTRSYATGMTPAERTQTQPTVINTPQGPQQFDVPKGAIYDRRGTFTGNPPLEGPSSGQPLIPTKPALGVERSVDESTKRYQDISDQAVTARSQQALLQNIQNEVQNYTPGKGADIIKDFRQIIMRVAPGLVDQKALASQESVDKIANQLADALGAGSDARMHVQQGANPSSHNTPQGIQLILNQLLGIGDYAQARAVLAAKQPGTGNIRQFEAQVGSQLDPRVFQYDRLTPDQAREYLANVSDLPTFIKRYDWAKDQGLLASQR